MAVHVACLGSKAISLLKYWLIASRAVAESVHIRDEYRACLMSELRSSEPA